MRGIANAPTTVLNNLRDAFELASRSSRTALEPIDLCVDRHLHTPCKSLFYARHQIILSGWVVSPACISHDKYGSIVAVDGRFASRTLNIF